MMIKFFLVGHATITMMVKDILRGEVEKDEEGEEP